MSATTVEILAFSPPQVNGRQLRVLVNIGGSQAVVLTGSRDLMRDLARDLLGGGNPPPAPAAAPAEPPPRKEHAPAGQIDGRRSRLAPVYQEILRHAARPGAIIAEICSAHGVEPSRFYAWRSYQKKKGRLS